MVGNPFKKDYSRQTVERMLIDERSTLVSLRVVERGVREDLENAKNEKSKRTLKRELLDLKMAIIEKERSIRELVRLLESDKQVFDAYDVF